MNITDAYNQLNKWINESQGVYIDIGEQGNFSFRRRKVFSHNELSNFELKNSLILPEEYKSFLINVGCVNIFSSELLAGIDILAPYDIADFSQHVFYNFGDDLYPQLLLTTSIPKLGYFGGFWMEEVSKNNYGIFYPEVPPELWIEECDFTNFNDWIIQLVQYRTKRI